MKLIGKQGERPCKVDAGRAKIYNLGVRGFTKYFSNFGCEMSMRR